MRESLCKTASFAVVHLSVAFGVTYALTGSAPVAAAVALIEPLANTAAYFVHERLWAARGARRAAPAPAAAAV
ncbi:MAG: DUF2061 domain-containing protein [Casimicrobiaceae bacterium]|nr:DUF2061 domain-containing protein [Casimicrobiaceae bacterium]MCX8098692.1 DUF2061 domain-containing protein [Casimicrobiaceae bacterium]MDW8312131.1 DUF2061 domain-containing protein [Burkholderiales bacterium]